MSVKDLFSKLENDENNFKSLRFISPVIENKAIRIRINSIIMSLRITKPKNFSGWGVFKPTSFKTAVFDREPTLAEKSEYLSLFPALHFIVCKQDGDVWFGSPIHESDSRFKISGLVPFYFAEEIRVFDVVQVRFDGDNCWYERPYEKFELKNIEYLRESFAKLVEPSKLSLTGLTQEVRNAYSIVWSTSEEAKKNLEEEKIKGSLSRAGAKYKSHIERKDSYTIEFEVGGEIHKSVVKKNGLGVESAGICLSGGDRVFDLQSLVGVIREGQNRHRIVRVGNNR